MIHKNSETVYREKIRPTTKNRHLRVLDALQELGEATIYEIADYINKPVHVFSGRLTELSGTKEYGKPLIESVGTRNNKYNNPCTIWRIKQVNQVPLTQQEMF